MRGFSLIELMVTVAIVGVLAAVAIPNFSEFGKRARFSEAKINLSTVFTAEQAFKAQFSTYTSRFEPLGYGASGVLWFNIGFDADFPPPPDAFQGTASCKQLCPATNCPAAMSAGWKCTTSSSNLLDGAGNALVTARTFRVGSHAHFTTSPVDWFTWTIDQNKQVIQVIPAN